jgi:hypothetical protein
MSEWQTIATAPKDGTEVLLFYRDYCNGGALVTSGYWDSSPGREWEATWQHVHGTGDADMWMPLPKPPFTREDYDAAPVDGTRYR